MSEYITYLKELFQPFGEVQMRRMFGGHGVFYDGLMIGLVADEELYLKVGPDTEGEFKALGLSPFEYQKGNKRVKMSYYHPPENTLEDAHEMTRWAELAYSAALRAKQS